MAGCCARDYQRFFGSRAAARDARRYRKHGLTGSARALADFAGDVEGASVLEVGGGVGAIELELLAGGAERATNVELSGGYEQAAAELAAERGMTKLVERRVADFVTDSAAIGGFDIVVMHRVVCCYPDVDALVATAAEHAHRRLLLTYPQERRLVRVGVRIANAFFSVTRSTFRVYVHPVARITEMAERHGLCLAARERHGRLWESAAFSR